MLSKSFTTAIERYGFLVLLVVASNLLPSRAQFDTYVISACSNIETSLPEGEISGIIASENKLNGQEKYEFNKDCRNVLNYPNGGSVIFHFESFDVEYDADGNCQYDFFSINSDKYCGYLDSKKVCYGGQSSVDVHWKADDLYSWTGFVIRFETHQTNECQCLADEPGFEERRPCVFPFVLDGITHFQCAKTPSDSISEPGSYCATSVNSSQNLLTYGMCDETIFACERICRTTNGKQCLIPWRVHGVQYNGCFRNQKDGSFGCPFLMGRDISGFSDDIKSYGEGSCDLSACDTVLACDAHELNTSRSTGQIIPFTGYNDGSYPFNLQCSVDLHNYAYKSFYVTLNLLSLTCQDSLEFLDPLDPVNVLRFCGDTRGTDYESFSFCWNNFANSSDFLLDIEFTSGRSPKNQRTGYLIHFDSTEDIDLCPAARKNDMACTDVKGQNISADYEIYSYNYPYVYPTGLFCLWKIMPDASRPTSFPVVQIHSIDLGIPWNDIDALVDSVDTVTVSGSDGLHRILTPNNETDGLSDPLVLVSKSGYVQFQSAPFFNFHNSFHMSVNYLDPKIDNQTFVSAGHCLSVDQTSLCQFPFSNADGNAYETCWKFPGDVEASCKTADGNKVYCDMSLPQCRPPVPEFRITSVLKVNSTAVKIHWEVEDNNRNWDYFSIFVDGHKVAEVADLEYTVGNMSGEESYFAEVQIVSYSETGETKSVTLQSSAFNLTVYVRDRTKTTLEINWSPVDFADSFQLQARVMFIDQITQELFRDKDAVVNFSFASKITDSLSYLLQGLHPGMSYNLTLVALDASNRTVASSTSIKTTLPEPLTEVENRLHVTWNSNDTLVLNGELTQKTTFSFIAVIAYEATDITTTQADTKGYNFVEIAAYSESVDVFVRDNFTFSIANLGILEPGTLYKFEISTFADRIPGEPTTLEYISNPDPVVNLRAEEVTTSSFKVAWNPPQLGKYTSFLVRVAQSASNFFLGEAETTDTEYILEKGVEPGETYSAEVTTISYGTSLSAPSTISIDAEPDPVQEFGALAFKSDPRVVSLQFLPPETTWHHFKIYSWELNRAGDIIDTDEPITFDSSLTFPLNSTTGTDEFDIKYNSYGSLYKATVNTVSVNGRESVGSSVAFVTIPLQLDSLTVLRMDDFSLTVRWDLTRENSKFNRLSVSVSNEETMSRISGAQFNVLDTAASGNLTLSIAQDAVPFVRTYNVRVATISFYDTPDFYIEKTSKVKSFLITPIVPEIKNHNSTLTSIKAIMDLSPYGADSSFAAEFRDVASGELNVNLTFESSSCSQLTDCLVEFTGLKPNATYNVKISVIETNFTYKVSSYISNIQTASFPTDFRILNVSSTSFYFEFTFENLPFGEESVAQYSFVVDESNSDQIATDTIMDTNFWSDYMIDGSPYQATASKSYPMSTDDLNRWSASIGVDSCDVTSHTVCNGPLESNTWYTVWIVGRTRDLKSFVQRQLTSLKTRHDVGDITNYRFDFLTKDVAKVFWTAPENFVDVSEEDFFIVSLNDIEVSRLPATAKELELALEDLSLCDDYTVAIQPVRRQTPFKPAELTIRTWSNKSHVSEILQDYPESIDECGVCPNVNLTKLCVFPFEFNGNVYNSCAPFDGPGSLNCKDENNLVLSCHEAAHCLPEAPSLSDLRFETIVPGYSVKISWDVSSDSYSNFNIFVNGELSNTTKETERVLENLTVGEKYDIKVEMDAFGRTDNYQIISFIFSDQKQNAFSHNITNTSATVSWDMFETATVNMSEDSGMTIQCKVDSRDFVHLFLEPEEVDGIERTEELEENTTSLDIRGHPGIPVKCVLSPKDGSTNISTVSPLVPNRLSVQNNNLKLTQNETWKLSGKLTKGTGSEKLNFEVSIKHYIVSIVEDGELWLIAKTEMNQTVFPKIQCNTANCVSSSSLEFEQSVDDLRPVPGSISQVDCFGNTGPSDAEHTSLVHVEEPNPVEFLDVYFVDETTVKLSWRPPRVGFYRGFRLIHRLHDGTEITKEIISGYMRYIADELVPGSSHLVQVLTIADEEGLVVSTPKDIAVDTAPRLPSNLTIQIEDRKLSVSFQRPDFGFYDEFRIDIFEIDDNQEKDLASQDFLPNTTFDFDVNLEKLATVYEIEVRSISKNGRFNFFPLSDFAMTGVGHMEMQLHEIVRSANWFCFVWDVKEDVVKKMDTVSSKIVQDNHLVSTALFRIANQQLGLNCLNFSSINLERSFTVEVVMSKTQMNLSVSTAPVKNQLPESEEKRFELNITTECDSSQCHVYLEDNKLTNRSQFHFEFELFNKTSNESKSGVYRGSDCSDDIHVCSYLLENLNPSTQYGIIVTVHLYQQWIPQTFTHQFSTKADKETMSLGIIFLIILLVLAVPAIGGVVAFLIITKLREFREKETSENQMGDIYCNPDNSEAGQETSESQEDDSNWTTDDDDKDQEISENYPIVIYCNPDDNDAAQGKTQMALNGIYINPLDITEQETTRSQIDDSFWTTYDSEIAQGETPMTGNGIYINPLDITDHEISEYNTDDSNWTTATYQESSETHTDESYWTTDDNNTDTLENYTDYSSWTTDDNNTDQERLDNYTDGSSWTTEDNDTGEEETSENHLVDVYCSPDDNDAFVNRHVPMPLLTFVANDVEFTGLDLEPVNLNDEPNELDEFSHLENNAFEDESSFEHISADDYLNSSN